MTAAKITNAYLLLFNHMALLVVEDGRYDVMTVPHADARLAESGQRAVWPEEPGLAVLHDLPGVSDMQMWCYQLGSQRLWRDYGPIVADSKWQLIATLKVRDGTPTIEQVAP